MITLLWAAVTAAGAPAIAEPERRDAVERCQPALARKVKGDAENVTVIEFRKTGRTTLLKGQMEVLERASGNPGELRPHHVLSTKYSYECRFTGSAAPRVRVSRQIN
jgi:hypothetical protein